MSVSAKFRRIILDNLNVIGVINDHTGDQQIKQAKIVGLPISGGAVPQSSAELAVSASFGVQITFTTPFAAIQRPSEGDYKLVIEGRLGQANVNVTVVSRTPTGAILIPDADGTDIEWAAIPYTQ